MKLPKPKLKIVPSIGVPNEYFIYRYKTRPPIGRIYRSGYKYHYSHTYSNLSDKELLEIYQNVHNLNKDFKNKQKLNKTITKITQTERTINKLKQKQLK